jgi:hypothetical protein
MMPKHERMMQRHKSLLAYWNAIIKQMCDVTQNDRIEWQQHTPSGSAFCCTFRTFTGKQYLINTYSFVREVGNQLRHCGTGYEICQFETLFNSLWDARRNKEGIHLKGLAKFRDNLPWDLRQGVKSTVYSSPAISAGSPSADSVTRGLKKKC